MIKKHKLTDLNDNIKSEYDLFLSMASYEERCLAIPQNINLDKFLNAVIFLMEDFTEYTNYNKTKLCGIFNGKVNCIELKHSDPIFTADAMIEALTEIQRKKNIGSIAIDITTFTHESLLILFKVIRIIFPNAKITYFYVNAAEYDSKNKKNDKWLSKGIGEIRSILGYSGNILPSQKTYLIVVVGYEHERATDIINAFEPNILALGYARSDNTVTEKDQDANKHYFDLVEQMASSYKEIERFEIKCNDPFETCKRIEKLINSHKKMNVVIVPLNNKISTLGVAIAAMNNDDIQLCYAPALTYNYSDYSTVGESCYEIEIEQKFES